MVKSLVMIQETEAATLKGSFEVSGIFLSSRVDLNAAIYTGLITELNSTRNELKGKLKTLFKENLAIANQIDNFKAFSKAKEIFHFSDKFSIKLSLMEMIGMFSEYINQILTDSK